MSWLLFLDESGHDHKQLPYEVRGGVAIEDRRLWAFITSVSQLERECFGVLLSDFKKEFKGQTLFDKKAFRWASQAADQEDTERRKNARSFLSKGMQKMDPSRDEFTAYGQACLQMAQGVFRLLRDHNAKLFASMIPQGVKPLGDYKSENFLRKDHVFLLERFANFCALENQQGLLVMDQVEEQSDMRFVRQLERYFVRTQNGNRRSEWIVPAPLFSSSYLSIPIQAADLCIYSINWGFRQPNWTGLTRSEVVSAASGWIDRLQWKHKSTRDGEKRSHRGIVLVKNPYGSGEVGT